MNLNRIMANQRVLFYIDSCPECGIWKSFIWRINAQIKHDKKIKIIDCTLLSNRGPFTNSLQRLFNNHIESFPVLFFDGIKIDNANSPTEAESFIRSLLHKDFIVTPKNEFMFNKECRYITKGLFRKKVLVCE